MTRFNPDFWETTLEAEGWEQFSTEDGLWADAAPDGDGAMRRRARELWPQVREAMEAALTERQLEVVQLYYLAELNQRQISERIGITQQAVSECLYGKLRDGHTVGGALRKLRKTCAERGIRWGV